jgi:hypothetical protein
MLAQNATPNAGFENWNSLGNRVDPADWNTLNPNTAIIGVLTCTRASGTDAHSGSYAIKLTTKSVFGVTANGIASTGTLITTPPYGVTGGIPFTGRPDSITGWYKYTPQGADQGFVELQLLGSVNTDTIGYVRFETPNATVSSFTRFSAPVTYISPNNPSNSIWIISSSRGTNPVVNSSIIVDDIAMVFNPTSVATISASNNVQLLNNPASDELHLKLSENSTYLFQLVDISGSVILQKTIDASDASINVAAVKSGLYYYQVKSHQALTTLSGKVVISR